MKRVYVSEGREPDMVRQRTGVQGEEEGSTKHSNIHEDVMENGESNNFLELDSR